MFLFSFIAFISVNEISILFSLIVSFGLKAFFFRPTRWFVFCSAPLFVLGFFMVLPSAFELVVQKIATSEITHERNADFSLLKAAVVFFISHSLFVFSDSYSIWFAGLTSLPYVVLLIIPFIQRAPRIEVFSLASVYIVTVSIFKTFQHLRIYPFIYVRYFAFASTHTCRIVIAVNICTYLLHIVFFSIVSPPESPLIFYLG